MRFMYNQIGKLFREIVKFQKKVSLKFIGDSSMRLIRKAKTGIKLLFTKGPKAFVAAFKNSISGSLNPDETLIAFNLLKADSQIGVMIDVGAHHGHTLAPFAKHGWQIYAFEPDSDNRQELKKLFGGQSNVHIDHRALSDHAQKQAKFYKSEESSGVSGLSAFLPSHKSFDEVEITTLELFLVEQNLLKEQIDFMKIDTEGFDLMVLKGVPWKQNSPRVIVCEFEDAKTTPLGHNYHDIAQFLIGHGYKIIISEWHPIEKYGGVHSWRCFSTYPFDLQDPNSWGNIIAVKNNNLYEALKLECKINN